MKKTDKNKILYTTWAIVSLCVCITLGYAANARLHDATLPHPQKEESVEETADTSLPVDYGKLLLANTALTPPDSNEESGVPQPDNNPLNNQHYSPFYLQDPPGIGTVIQYNPETNTYEFQYQTGNVPYGPGAYMDINEYINYDLQQSIQNYWHSNSVGATGKRNGGGGLIPELHVGGDLFESIFGSNTIDIRPSGNIEVKFGVKHTQTQNYSLPVKQRRHTDFDFDQDIQLNMIARVGDKIEFNLNYATNQLQVGTNNDVMKLKYGGKEDDILQLIEFGNVTMPLNSTLITGSQNLFGVKGQFKFGNLTVTGVAAQKKGATQSASITNGAAEEEFYFSADQYEENRHFFLAQFFRDHYNEYLSTLPLVGSPIVITKIEVWRTTIGAATNENRNIVAFTDLGEADPEFASFSYNPMYQGGQYPDDNINNLMMVVDTSLYRTLSNVSANMHSIGMNSGKNYEKLESARLLSPSEYTVNTKLGFISLNSALSADQVLAVAFQYTVIGDDNVYQVGEFSNEVTAPNCIRVKLLKSSNTNTKSPLWKLMMKNVYSLSAYQVSSEKFRLNILYTGDAEGVPNGFFTQGSEKGIPLIRLLGLDRLNQQQDPNPDGIFDFIDNAATVGGTINSNNGRIYFPTIEPFGKDLRAVITEPELADKYAFDSLYTMTKTMAQQITNKNKFYIEGTYRSSYGSEFRIPTTNVAQGSVKVTAGGITLQENVDYTVNYDMGTVSIINQGYLNSGTPINVSWEPEDEYGTDQYLFGANLDYAFSPNFNIGATLMNLRERPFTNKVNYGDEPINNFIWGMNFAYKAELPFVTKAVDLLSFHSTTTQSFLNLEGEFAHFVPGHARAIGKKGTTYIDNFEAAKTTIALNTFANWVLASTPQGQPDLFPEAGAVSITDNVRKQLAYGYNRAHLSWYIVDQSVFYNGNSATPSNLTAEDLSAPYARAVYEPELFPYKEYDGTTISTYMPVFNLAYYPSEKGPYNYDVTGSEGYSHGINDDGTLREPKSRWGGIMRKFDNTDFESSNYEYIEFWMMDPFIENENHTGGKLYFNLGDISEDILRDGMKSFESGLPADGGDEDVEFTVWGRVPTVQQIVNAFDLNLDSRPNQDVGYDGLRDDREQIYFNDNYLQLIANAYGNASQAYVQALRDPSNDDYHFYRGSDYDQADVKVVERYKYYNNSEGNSPTDNQSPESYPTSASSIPNLEDMNNDNTLSEDEKYYQYVIQLDPQHMVVGENYINDVYEAVSSPLPNGERLTTKWYQFRIPIHNPDRVVNNISGFNSIRFMRMFLRDFEEPIICRFATFELVRSDWRTYNLGLQEEGDYTPTQGDGEGSFYVGTVSYEENSNRTPIPYVLPPGIERETIAGLNTYQINEQALTLKAVDLVDGDARAVYKSTSYDLRNFETLQMAIHAESIVSSNDLQKGDISTFIRLGSDFTDNYYEYEIPVEITPWGVGKDTFAIWPLANNMVIYLDSLVSLKMERNLAVRRGDLTSNLIPYTKYLEDGNKMTIVGNPNLGDVTTIMIGIRNPKKQSMMDNDDMEPKSVEVWVNELRLVGFDDRQGFAALLRARMNIADVGDLTVSGTYSTPGFGSIEQSLTERSHETNVNLDIATNIDGGKLFFPEKWNIKIPFHYDYSMGMALPEYNPLNPDVKLQDDLALCETAAERDSLRRLSTAYTQRQNINLMNVRKERSFDKGSMKMHPWDIENFDLSYSYSELIQRDEDLEMNNELTHNGEIGYTFSTNPKNYRPFSKMKWTRSKWLQLIRDFNITPMPKNVVVRTSMRRELQAFKYRPKSQGNIIVDTSFVKSFDWTRNYALNWDIFQSLKLEFRADASARIDEPDGLIDTRTEKDSIWHNVGRGGRTTDYRQIFSGTYQLPINKIPLFNWVNANVRYQSNYQFTASALSLAYLGNTIQNSNTIQGNVNLNFVTLYNNIPYLKKVNQGNRKPQTSQKKDKGQFDKNKEKGEEETVAAKDSIKEKPNYGKIILDGTLRFFMMVRNVSANYTRGAGTILPGYMGTPKFFGIDLHDKSPGFLFVFGGQPDVQAIGAQRHWLTTDSLMNTAYQRTRNENLNLRATVEPFRDFRIEVSATRRYTENYSEYFHVDEEGILYHYTPQRNGSFSMTYCGLRTFFQDYNQLFEDFRDIRMTIANRLAEANPNYTGEVNPETGFPEGYSEVSQDVLMGAFFSAYMGKDAEKMDLSTPFLKIPLPNWRLTYNGFSKIKGIDKVFQSLSIAHSYTCTYQIGGFATNLSYVEGAGAVNALGDFIPREEMNQMALSEQFAPLIGFDMTLRNSMLLKVEYKQSRNVALSFTNNQITETSSFELAVSGGYRFKDLKIGLIFAGQKRQFVSDLNVTAGVGIKSNQTQLRKIQELQDQVTAGSLTATINVAAEYQFSQMVGIKFYYDQTINRPKVQNQYNNMNFETGIALRLMLSQ
ncbi:MAG: cell surface protein SprA [Bacteroidales bacterium]|nr:cell surface protein SprA [Bacteroidales bacterium]